MKIALFATLVAAVTPETSPALAAPWIQAEQGEFAPVTPGGSVSGTQIVTVTNLEAEGAGSLAEALAVEGPKIIVFEVGGTIRISGDLTVGGAFTTVAGETAPSPGITLEGAGLRIRSHDIVVRHLAIRAHPSDIPEVNGVLDTLSIGGNPSRYGGPIRNVLIENVSVSWGVDENLSVWEENTGNIQLRSMIIAEALDDAGHPEGTHSKGMLVGSGIDNVSVVDSLFAHNVDRQPRISPNAQTSVERNVVYNPGQVGIEIFVACEGGEPARRIAKSVLIAGPDTYGEVKLYNFNNYEVDIDGYGDPACKQGWASLDFEEATEDEARDVTASVLAHAGARPNDRNATDRRILDEVVARSGQVRDEPTNEITRGNGRRYFEMPADPLAEDDNGRMAIDLALCQAHLALGGLPSSTCQHP